MIFPTVTMLPYAKIAAAITIGVVAFGVGWTVNGWRLNSSQAKAIAERDKQITDMREKILTQNAAIDVLAEKKTAADEKRQIAEKYNLQQSKRISSLESKISSLQGVDCESVLKEAWEQFK